MFMGGDGAIPVVPTEPFGLAGHTAARVDPALSSACDPNGVAVNYGTEFLDGAYAVTTVTVTDLDTDQCAHRTLTVVLRDAAGVVVGRGSILIPSHGNAVRVAMTKAPASSITGVEIVIG